MRTKYKAWSVPYLEEHKEIAISIEHANDISINNDNVVLEIGSGKGDFLLQMARKYPNLIFIGIEKNVTCSGFTCKKLVENEITNAFIVDADVEKCFPIFAKGKIKHIFLNFSDPWPKKKHAKRRLTETKFLNSYYELLTKGGKIYFKSDNQNLFDYSILTLSKAPFNILSLDNNYDGHDEFDAQTEYERNFRNQGVAIHRVIVEKKEDKNV